VGALLLVVFLLGFVPTWWKSRECSSSLSEAERQLNLARMQNTLASAANDVRRGDYESARQSASDFFTSVRAETDRGDASALSLAQREEVQPLLTQRDEIITLLALNLTGYRSVFGGCEGQPDPLAGLLPPDDEWRVK